MAFAISFSLAEFVMKSRLFVVFRGGLQPLPEAAGRLSRFD
jgi:hypothetical protein